VAKTSGLGSVLTVADAGGTSRAITNDITNYAFTTPRGTQDVTGLNSLGHETILLLADFTITLNGVFNPTVTTSSHAVFSTVTTTSVQRSTNIQVTVSGGTPQMTLNVMYTDYQITRANTGELTWQVPGQNSDGTVPTWA
jgi:hypothetical protein